MVNDYWPDFPEVADELRRHLEALPAELWAPSIAPPKVFYLCV